MTESLNIAILIFDGAEELDFQGPWEVLTMVNTVRAFKKTEGHDKVYLVSETAAFFQNRIQHILHHRILLGFPTGQRLQHYCLSCSRKKM